MPDFDGIFLDFSPHEANWSISARFDTVDAAMAEFDERRLAHPDQKLRVRQRSIVLAESVPQLDGGANLITGPRSFTVK